MMKVMTMALNTAGADADMSFHILVKDDVKKPRMDDDDLKLTAKQKKKAAKARKLGMSYHVMDGELVGEHMRWRISCGIQACSRSFSQSFSSSNSMTLQQ